MSATVHLPSACKINTKKRRTLETSRKSLLLHLIPRNNSLVLVKRKRKKPCSYYSQLFILYCSNLACLCFFNFTKLKKAQKHASMRCGEEYSEGSRCSKGQKSICSMREQTAVCEPMFRRCSPISLTERILPCHLQHRFT